MSKIPHVIIIYIPHSNWIWNRILMGCSRWVGVDLASKGIGIGYFGMYTLGLKVMRFGTKWCHFKSHWKLIQLWPWSEKPQQLYHLWAIRWAWSSKTGKHHERFWNFLKTFTQTLKTPLFKPLYYAWNGVFAHICFLLMWNKEMAKYWREVIKIPWEVKIMPQFSCLSVPSASALIQVNSKTNFGFG